MRFCTCGQPAEWPEAEALIMRLVGALALLRAALAAASRRPARPAMSGAERTARWRARRAEAARQAAERQAAEITTGVSG